MDNEIVDILLELTDDLPTDRAYSKAEAYADILHMASENNGSFSTSRRKLMERWGWGSSRVVSFLSFLTERTIIEPLPNQNRTTITLKKCGFEGGARTTSEPLPNQNRTTFESPTAIKITDALRMILDVWDGLTEYEIEPIPEFGISSSQYSNLVNLVKTYGVHDVLQTIERIKSSDFLQGKKSGWKITFDWFLNAKNYKKIRSGKYNDYNKKPEKNSFNRFPQNNYDFELLEKKLPDN